MDCQICNPSTDDFNYCEKCADELRGLQEAMADITGESGWFDFPALLLPIDCLDHRKMVTAYFYGAQIPYKVNEKRHIEATDRPFYRWVSEREAHRFCECIEPTPPMQTDRRVNCG